MIAGIANPRGQCAGNIERDDLKCDHGASKVGRGNLGLVDVDGREHDAGCSAREHAASEEETNGVLHGDRLQQATDEADDASDLDRALAPKLVGEETGEEESEHQATKVDGSNGAVDVKVNMCRITVKLAVCTHPSIVADGLK